MQDRKRSNDADRIQVGGLDRVDCIVVSDGHRSYGAASENLSRRHEVVNVGRGNYVRDQIWHLNTVNDRHEVMKSKHNHWHRGVSTKYLDDYMNWFQGQEFRPDKRTVPDFIAEHLMSFIQGFR